MFDPNIAMPPLEKGVPTLSCSRKEFLAHLRKENMTPNEAGKIYDEVMNAETWQNDLYVVMIDRDVEHAFGDIKDGMFRLTVRRQDREPHIPWRHVQQMKNQLLSPEHEMCEIYPAESRKVDTANQYWFFGFNSTEIKFPFGMVERSVISNPDFLKAKQNPLPTDT